MLHLIHSVVVKFSMSWDKTSPVPWVCVRGVLEKEGQKIPRWFSECGALNKMGLYDVAVADNSLKYCRMPRYCFENATVYFKRYNSFKIFILIYILYLF